MSKFGHQPARQMLQDRGLSLAAFARQHNLNHRHVQPALYGDIAPSPELVNALCAEFDVPVTKLFVPEVLATGFRITGTTHTRAV